MIIKTILIINLFADFQRKNWQGWLSAPICSPAVHPFREYLKPIFKNRFFLLFRSAPVRLPKDVWQGWLSARIRSPAVHPFPLDPLQAADTPTEELTRLVVCSDLLPCGSSAPVGFFCILPFGFFSSVPRLICSGRFFYILPFGFCPAAFCLFPCSIFAPHLQLYFYMVYLLFNILLCKYGQIL